MAANILNKTCSLAQKEVKFWLPVLIAAFFIFCASSVKGSSVPALFPLQNIIFHFLIYLILAFFFARALKNTYANITPLKIFIFTVFFGISYALSDEWHQSFVPCRTPSGFDIFIDAIGVFIGSLIYCLR